MNKQNLLNIIKSAKMVISKHAPEILTGVGIAGMVTTTVLSVKATPKAIKLIEEKKKEDNVEKLTVLETVKVVWKPYITPALTGAASIACLIGASSVSVRRTAALAAAYQLSETAFTEYKDKVIETIGDKKEKVVREQVGKERIEKKPVSNSQVFISKKGNTLCFDPISGRYFKSDIDHIKRSVNELNRRMLTEMYISLNELYDELDINHIEIGDDLGWNIDRGLIDIDFSSQIADDGTPCIVLDFSIEPRYDFYKN